MAKRIKPIDLQKEIAKQLEKYADDVMGKTQAVAVAVAKKTVQTLKTSNAFQDHTGQYRKSFKQQPVEASMKNTAGAVVYAAGVGGSIGHLIEHGHMNRDGTSRVNANPHWREAAEQAASEFEDELTKQIGGIA
jgi:hypothetical protein